MCLTNKDKCCHFLVLFRFFQYRTQRFPFFLEFLLELFLLVSGFAHGLFSSHHVWRKFPDNGSKVITLTTQCSDAMPLFNTSTYIWNILFWNFAEVKTQCGAPFSMFTSIFPNPKKSTFFLMLLHWMSDSFSSNDMFSVLYVGSRFDLRCPLLFSSSAQ